MVAHKILRKNSNCQQLKRALQQYTFTNNNDAQILWKLGSSFRINMQNKNDYLIQNWSLLIRGTQAGANYLRKGRRDERGETVQKVFRIHYKFQHEIKWASKSLHVYHTLYNNIRNHNMQNTTMNNKLLAYCHLSRFLIHILP